jgi:hypothetical protein
MLPLHSRFADGGVVEPRRNATNGATCPVRLKYGYVRRVSEWPYLSFHRYVAQGIYSENWRGDIYIQVEGGD